MVRTTRPRRRRPANGVLRPRLLKRAGRPSTLRAGSIRIQSSARGKPQHLPRRFDQGAMDDFQGRPRPRMTPAAVSKPWYPLAPAALRAALCGRMVGRDRVDHAIDQPCTDGLAIGRSAQRRADILIADRLLVAGERQVMGSYLRRDPQAGSLGGAQQLDRSAGADMLDMEPRTGSIAERQQCLLDRLGLGRPDLCRAIPSGRGSGPAARRLRQPRSPSVRVLRSSAWRPSSESATAPALFRAAASVSFWPARFSVRAAARLTPNRQVAGTRHDAFQKLGPIGHRVGVRHRQHPGEAAGGRARRARCQRLALHKARVSQVAMEVDPSRD